MAKRKQYTELKYHPMVTEAERVMVDEKESLRYTAAMLADALSSECEMFVLEVGTCDREHYIILGTVSGLRVARVSIDGSFYYLSIYPRLNNNHTETVSKVSSLTGVTGIITKIKKQITTKIFPNFKKDKKSAGEGFYSVLFDIKVHFAGLVSELRNEALANLIKNDSNLVDVDSVRWSLTNEDMLSMLRSLYEPESGVTPTANTVAVFNTYKERRAVRAGVDSKIDLAFSGDKWIISLIHSDHTLSTLDCILVTRMSNGLQQTDTKYYRSWDQMPTEMYNSVMPALTMIKVYGEAQGHTYNETFAPKVYNNVVYVYPEMGAVVNKTGFGLTRMMVNAL